MPPFGDGGAATQASLNGPYDVTIDKLLNVYISEGSLVHRVGPSGTISTIAGSVFLSNKAAGNLPATQVRLTLPAAMAFDFKGDLYLTEGIPLPIRLGPPNDAAHLVRRIDSAGVIHTVAGDGSMGFSGDGGPARLASLASPLGVAIDALGNVVRGGHRQPSD